jgi:hypothetical protein
MCRLALQLSAGAPLMLTLKLVHATHPDLDRQIQLSRTGSVYEGHCGAVPAGHWHLELSDFPGGWSVRRDVTGLLDGVEIGARSTPGAS